VPTRLDIAKDIAQGKAPKDSARSPQWAKVRKEHLKQFPLCSVCETKGKINVHHIKPFHLHPELELEPSNLVTLCENWNYGVNCHLLFGHLGDYKNINPNVLQDIAIWNARLKEDNSNIEK
jgi:5-methylcytosine-specific restriction enzyme A